ncbi:MAG: hypothetical protein EOP80_07830 [Variovorax sp.]|nr:MAG: hypothetical protein EOP80_07830 [Variovorax sp.]
MLALLRKLDRLSRWSTGTGVRALQALAAVRPDPDPLKVSRDVLQADTVEQLVGEYLPQLSA